jgi:hypothetical protein
MARVTVGCKLPHGLTLMVGDKEVKVRGANTTTIIGGFGLTEIDEDFWNTWAQEHADWPMVKNGLIFAQAKRKDAEAEAKELKGEKTGLERLEQVVKDPATKKVVLAPADEADGEAGA